MRFIKNILVFELILCYCVLSKEIPSYVHLCKRNDPNAGECYSNRIYELMPHLLKGIPEMDVPIIDPFAFTEIKVDTGSSGSTNFDIVLLNGTVSGLRKLRVENHKIDFNKITFTNDLKIPEINIESTYKLNGRILLFELNGHGHFSFNATDLFTNSVWLASTYVKKNKTYLRIDDVKFDDRIQLKNIRVRMDNLFGENQVVTDTVNNAINDNVESLKDELEPIIKHTLIGILLDTFNRVYRLFPMDVLFPLE